MDSQFFENVQYYDLLRQEREQYIIYYCCDGVVLCLFGTVVANETTVHPPDRTDDYGTKFKCIDRIKQDSEKDLSRCQFVHLKSYMDFPGKEPGSTL